jgi:hypothetical protein
MIQKIEVQRFSLTSTKPFGQVLAAINDGLAIGPWRIVRKETGSDTPPDRSFPY